MKGPISDNYAVTESQRSTSFSWNIDFTKLTTMTWYHQEHELQWMGIQISVKYWIRQI